MKKSKFPFIIPPLGVRGLVLGLLLLITSCKKNSEPEPDLPPETQQGANTFGCYLNGKPWQPSENGIGSRNLYVQLDGQYFKLHANYDEDERDEIISLFSDKVILSRVGDYPLKKSTNFDNRSRFWDVNKNVDLRSFDADIISDGLLTITNFDTQKKFVSGKFWFSLQKGDVKYEAKEGRFDISY
jgi:hypothetical protein